MFLYKKTSSGSLRRITARFYTKPFTLHSTHLHENIDSIDGDNAESKTSAAFQVAGFLDDLRQRNINNELYQN